MRRGLGGSENDFGQALAAAAVAYLAPATFVGTNLLY